MSILNCMCIFLCEHICDLLYVCTFARVCFNIGVVRSVYECRDFFACVLLYVYANCLILIARMCVSVSYVYLLYMFVCVCVCMHVGVGGDN